MKCSTCNGKGYQESTIAKDNNFSPMITRCPNPECPNVNNYYNEVKKRFSASENKPLILEKGEQVIPNTDPNLFKDTNQPKDSITIHIDTSMLDKPEVLSKAINDQIEQELVKKNLNPNQEPNKTNVSNLAQEPNKTQDQQVVLENGDLMKVTPEQTDQELGEYETSYKHLPDKFVKQVKHMKEQDPSAQIMVTTPFGPSMCEKLSDANRIMGILNSYWKHEEDLSIADETDNVIIFPLGRALGL